MVIRVLVAQLEDVIAAGVAAILRASTGFEVEVLDEKCSKRVRNAWSQFEVVIASYETAVALAHDTSGRARIMALTTATTEFQVRTALELGLRGYLLTGCTANELIDAVRAIASGRTALSEVATSHLARSLSSPDLTARELAVLRVMAFGLSNKGIANHLSVSVGTVKTHVNSIIGKLHGRTRTEAAAIALRRGLIHLSEDPEPRSRRLPNGQAARSASPPP